jgi:hypothetical protein
MSCKRTSGFRGLMLNRILVLRLYTQWKYVCRLSQYKNVFHANVHPSLLSVCNYWKYRNVLTEHTNRNYINSHFIYDAVQTTWVILRLPSSKIRTTIANINL